MISKTDKKNTLQLLKKAEKMYEKAEKYGEKRKGLIALNAFRELHENDNAAYVYAIQKLKRMPPTIDEFLDSKEFMGDVIEIWPSIRESLREINPDIMTGAVNPKECLFLGAAGTAKSARAIVSQLYQLVVLDCFDWPQELFKLSKPTEIVFSLTSIKPSTAIEVLYRPLRQYFEFMPYARKYIEYNKDIDSELRLSQNITVRPVSANINSLIGHAICSGIVDEINFFARVEKSKQTPDQSTFDQAQVIERTILNRRKSRFDSKGPAPGIVCISAQTRYKGDFTDRRVKQAIDLNETDTSKGRDRVVYYREKRYDMNPKYDATTERFKILVGSDEYPTRIMEEDSRYTLPPNAQIELVPMEFYDDFRRDPEYALREIVGIATNAITPFIPQRQTIHSAANAWSDRDSCKDWTTENVYKLNEPGRLNDHGMPVVIEENLPKDGKMRYVHVDLSQVEDRTGIAICHIDGYVEVDNERLPYYIVDWVVNLEPDSINQVDVAEVRRWVSDLKLKYGLNIGRVSYDGFQSLESVQMLKKLGINAMNVSVDKTLEPYEILKSALYTNRIAIPDTELLKTELMSLELNSQANAGKGKVDHLPTLTKDAADAVTGAVYNASMSYGARANTGHGAVEKARPSTPSRAKSRNGATI